MWDDIPAGGEGALLDPMHVARLVLENVPDGMNLLDLRTNRYVFMNPRQVALSGFTMEELNALSAEEALARVHPDDVAVPREQQMRIAAGLDPELVVEYRWRVKSGEYRWFSDRRALIRDADGKPLYLVGVSHDITDERAQNTEAAQMHRAYARALEEQVRRRTSELVASERRYRLFTESTTDLMFAIGQDRRIIWASPHVREVLGWEPAALTDMPLVVLLESVDRARVLGALEPLCDGLPLGDAPDRLDVRVSRRGGGFRWMALRLMAARSEDGTLQSVVAGFTDIETLVSERARATAQAELLRAVTDAALEAQVLLQAVRRDDGRITDLLYLDANRAACEYLGLPRERLLGRAITDVVPDRTVTAAFLEQLALAMETGEPLVLDDYPIGAGLHGDDQYIDVLAHAVSADRVSMSWRNVTERHRVAHDLATSEAQLREAAAQKNRFISALSHELRNPLASARLALWALQRKGEGDTDLALRVLDRQLAQARVVLQMETLDVHALLKSISEDALLPMRTKGVEFRLSLPDVPVRIRADRTRITQALTNLLQNATKFTEVGGVIALDVTPDEERGVVLITVRDTGIGMDEETLAAIFTPFGVAPRADPLRPMGLGLGLSIARQMIERHGGTVTASSAGPGEGSVFEVTLPMLSDADAGDVAPMPDAEASDVRSLRVLVIEDDAALGAMMAHVLRMLGHVPLSAASGPRGLVMAAREHPDVVLCDIGMPGMDGYAVASALRADRTLRGIPCIALSGFASPQDVDAAHAAGFDLHLPKPTTPEALQRALGLVSSLVEQR